MINRSRCACGYIIQSIQPRGDQSTAVAFPVLPPTGVTATVCYFTAKLEIRRQPLSWIASCMWMLDYVWGFRVPMAGIGVSLSCLIGKDPAIPGVIDKRSVSLSFFFSSSFLFLVFRLLVALTGLV